MKLPDLGFVKKAEQVNGIEYIISRHFTRLCLASYKRASDQAYASYRRASDQAHTFLAFYHTTYTGSDSKDPDNNA